MKKVAIWLLPACLALAAGGVAAQDAKKSAMATKDMTVQQCKDHMATSKSNMKKDDAAMKKDAMCADVLKKEGAPKTAAPVKK